MKKLAQVSLLLSSLIFYGYWDLRFLPLLCGSIVFNFICGNLIFQTPPGNLKKIYLTGSVALNIALLVYFKYLNFFIKSTGYFLSMEFQTMDILLPLGISFFTFTQIAYLVDVYQSKATPGGACSYGLFVTVFPHLIAGPVLHHRDMISQFNDPVSYSWSANHFAHGTFLFIMGLSKKVLIADPLFSYVSPVFDQNQQIIPFIQAWVGALAYSIELYFDFSGYSDMAMGLGLYFNLKLPLNFQSPYQASSIIDFWRRWHISLSNFLKDYLYIPLGGNRGGERSKLCNLLITMFLGGVWHGANWTFIVWGLCHGFFLVINHLWRKLSINLPSFFSRGLTLLCVVVAFTIFRAPNLETAYTVIKGMFGFNGVVLPESYEAKLAFLKTYGVIFKVLPLSNVRINDLILIVICLCIALFLPNSMYWKERFLKRPIPWGIACAVALVTCVINLDAVTEFLYYQF